MRVVVASDKEAYSLSAFLADSAFIFYARSCRSGGVSFDVRI